MVGASSFEKLYMIDVDFIRGVRDGGCRHNYVALWFRTSSPKRLSRKLGRNSIPPFLFRHELSIGPKYSVVHFLSQLCVLDEKYICLTVFQL